MTQATYDKIGKTYDLTRKADPEIVAKILHYLQPNKTGCCLDMGCGSGNYTQALFQSGFNVCGIDLSEEMLKKAREKNPQIQWIKGDAKALPFKDSMFDGVICTLATHHIKDIKAAFQEAFRVINKGQFVIFTSFQEQMKTLWLNDYFPNLMKKSASMMHSQTEIFQTLHSAGFRNIKTDKFFVSNELQDLFLHAGKYRPHLYLDDKVRSGMSTFSLENDQEMIMQGCEKLQQDILSGKIEKVIQSYGNDLGDYAFVMGQKE